MLDEAATRDSDDEEPLACPADESRPLGLLAARRTPFEKHTAEAFAQGVLGDDRWDLLHCTVYKSALAYLLYLDDEPGIVWQMSSGLYAALSIHGSNAAE